MKAKSLLCVALAASLAGVSTAGAQQRSSGDNIFEEIRVTAKKREQSIYEVPVAMSAFTGATIEKAGITDLTDIGKFVPNLNVTGFSAGHTSSVNPFIRGIGLQDHLITTDPGVGVYVDGVYLGRQVGQNWSLANIERVEVLRGPQGTLYGRNSIGGTINIITKKPSDGEGGRIGMEVGSRGRVNADFYTNVELNDEVAMSFSGAFKRRDGIGKFLLLADPESDVGELQDVSARIALEWDVSDDLTILLAADGNDGDNGLRPYTTLIDEVPNGALFNNPGRPYRNSDLAADPYDSNSGQATQTRVTNKAFGVSMTADWSISPELNARLILSDRHSEYESGLDDDSLFDDFLSFPEVGEADQDSAEIQLNGEYGQWDFVAGLYFFNEEGFNDQNPYTFNGGPGDFFLAQDLDSRAIYGNVGYQLTDRVRVSGGLRYTEDEKDARTNINSSLIVESASRDWDELSWELAGTLDLNEDINLYGTVQSGYQSGQFPPRPFCLFGSLDFSQPGNVSRPNCFVANDNVTAVNYEVGVKGQPLEMLQLSIALFYTDYSDLPYQVSTTSGSGFDTRNIIVDQESTGVELEGLLVLSDNFTIHSSLGYIDADVKDPEAVAPLTPELTFSLSPEVSWRTGGGEMNFRMDYSYRDDMYGEPSPDPGRFTQIDSRSLLNLDLSFTTRDEDWTIGIYGRNVFDERYDNARLNTGDYVLVMLSNDASEYGMRFARYFD